MDNYILLISTWSSNCRTVNSLDAMACTKPLLSGDVNWQLSHRFADDQSFITIDALSTSSNIVYWRIGFILPCYIQCLQRDKPILMRFHVVLYRY